MKKKEKIALMGVFALLIGISVNLDYAWNDYGMKDSRTTLSLFVLAQAGGSDGGGGMCTGRGGTEMSELVLRREKCTRYIAVGGNVSGGVTLHPSGVVGGSIGGGIVYQEAKGERCSCLEPLSGYSGKLGCNLTWETGCK